MAGLNRGGNASPPTTPSGEDSGENDNSDPSFVGGYSKKKQQYVEQEIHDRSGTYRYGADPATYKKARK